MAILKITDPTDAQRYRRAMYVARMISVEFDGVPCKGLVRSVKEDSALPPAWLIDIDAKPASPGSAPSRQPNGKRHYYRPRR